MKLFTEWLSGGGGISGKQSNYSHPLSLLIDTVFRVPPLSQLSLHMSGWIDHSEVVWTWPPSMAAIHVNPGLSGIALLPAHYNSLTLTTMHFNSQQQAIKENHQSARPKKKLNSSYSQWIIGKLFVHRKQASARPFTIITLQKGPCWLLPSAILWKATSERSSLSCRVAFVPLREICYHGYKGEELTLNSIKTSDPHIPNVWGTE